MVQVPPSARIGHQAPRRSSHNRTQFSAPACLLLPRVGFLLLHRRPLELYARRFQRGGLRVGEPVPCDRHASQPRHLRRHEAKGVELVVFQVEALEVGQVYDCAGQAFELVVLEVAVLEARHVSDLGGERGEPVVVEEEPLDGGEQSNLDGQGGESVVREAQLTEPFEHPNGGREGREPVMAKRELLECNHVAEARREDL
mmetsp:Transcript_4389/g.11113  ORF Transcript_4389/g.11113 Transcript_4389/m.11113 type:complete len:200 (-) Transcript_4389:452-1051(-)